METLFSPADRRMTLTLGQLAEVTGIPATTLREWSRRGLIPGGFRPFKGSRHRFRRESIERWWESMHDSRACR